MKLTTSWLKPPYASAGIDHLGTQAPCVMIYGQLLPGITNVTDRARYYSLYTWLVWSYDQRYAKDDFRHFVEFFRRADCLFTLTAEQHARSSPQAGERHGAAMVGRDKLVPALARLHGSGELRLSTYATTLEGAPLRYFKNKLGGLSQYYAGMLVELQLMETRPSSWSHYTSEYGAPLAQCVDSAVQGERFWQVVEKDLVTLEDLDALSDFCACRIPHSREECERLTNIFFDTNKCYAEQGQQRRRSLALIQQLVDALPSGCELTEDVFRACVYSGALPNGQNWDIPEALQLTRSFWAVYVRNDLMSVAFQTIFAICLKALQPQTASQFRAFRDVESFADWFTRSDTVVRALDELKVDSFADLVVSSRELGLTLADWTRDGHEFQLGCQMVGSWKQGVDHSLLLSQSLKLLVMLVARDDSEQPPYSGLAITPEALRGYPINLASLRSRSAKWQAMSLVEVIFDLVLWSLDTHLRVALRKLRESGNSTFQLRPSERGLEKVGIKVPEPSRTLPRFKQAVQVLRDLGVLEYVDDGTTRLTASGRPLMEASSV